MSPVTKLYDLIMVFLGLRSRHASRLVASTPRTYRARHAWDAAFQLPNTSIQNPWRMAA